MTTANRVDDHAFAAPPATMGDALKDCLSPEAIAMILSALQSSPYLSNSAPAHVEPVVRQVEWFRDLLLDQIGVDECNRIYDDLCL